MEGEIPNDKDIENAFTKAEVTVKAQDGTEKRVPRKFLWGDIDGKEVTVNDYGSMK